MSTSWSLFASSIVSTVFLSQEKILEEDWSHVWKQQILETAKTLEISMIC